MAPRGGGSSRTGTASWLLAGVAAMTILCPGGRARAREADAVFRPNSSPASYFSQEGARVVAHSQLGLGTVTSYPHDRLFSARTGVAAPSGRDGGTGRMINHLGISTGLLGLLEVGARLPVALFQDPRGGRMHGQGRGRASLFGNIDLAAKLRLVEHTRLLGFRLAIATTAALPTGSASSMYSEGRPSARPRLVAGYERGRLSAVINGGYNFRRRSDLSGQKLGGEIAGGAALAYQLSPQRLWVQGETYASVSPHRQPDGHRYIPAEAIVGIRWALAPKWIFQGGLGTNLTDGASGYDVPHVGFGVRALATVTYQRGFSPGAPGLF